LGNSQFNAEKEYAEQGWRIVNRVKAIRKCVDKKAMFRAFEKAGVKSLSFFDLKTASGLIHAGTLVSMGKKMVFRRGRAYLIVSNTLDFVRNYGLFDYATVFEDKLLEWRVLVYKGKVFKVMKKDADDDGVFALKQESTRFRRVDSPLKEVAEQSVKAAAALGLDLCGVDVCLTKKGDVKVIEANSGMALGKHSCRLLAELINAEGVKNQ